MEAKSKREVLRIQITGTERQSSEEQREREVKEMFSADQRCSWQDR